ncbi:prostatic acid phosphatase-like isoform X2 [Adelges cooleyi]|uniref:prostatic acid phosphatase-like isoform X2 n=1 Tax=Adelges cooleyi TaxID=133065 RepID=UPI0021806E92|nr:prostatic acid phosphatase-like isoform X2 [Adelges cooleyi]
MNKFVSIVLGLCVVDVWGFDPLESKYGQLVFSSVIYRHGDRAIYGSYANDIWADEKYWPMGFGQLTDIGINQHLELGKWLKERYSDFLPDRYSPEDIYVRCTDVDRTIVSALANLKGMYPPIQGQEGRAENFSQIVPVHTVAEGQDKLYSLDSCPRYDEEMLKLHNDVDLHKFYRQYDGVFQYIRQKSGLLLYTNFVESNITNMLYDALLIESLYNYTLPEWTKQIYPEPLETIVIKNFELSTYNTVLKKLRSGPLLKEIVTHMYEKANGMLTPDRKLWVYSNHDFIIASLLNTMNIYNHQLVPYAACVMIELRRNSNYNYVVIVSYRNDTQRRPYLLHVPGCDAVDCDLHTFIDVLTPVLSVDRDFECFPEHASDFLELWFYFSTVILIAVVLTLFSYMASDKIAFCFKRRTDYITC